MFLQSALFFVVAVRVSVRASQTVSPVLEVDRKSGLDDAVPSDCPSCVLSRFGRNSTSLGQHSDMVEAVKRHILQMLHLSARPNLTQPVPRAAMLNAIRKLHVGHIAEDGRVEIEEDQTPSPPETPSEIITFAEPGESVNSVTFDLLMDGGGAFVVEQANVWIFLRVSKVKRLKEKVLLRLLCQRDDEDDRKEDESISEKMVDTRRSGWHMLTISKHIQELLDSGSSSLQLQVSCPLCGEAGASPVLATGTGGQDESHRPFLMVALQDREEAGQKRVKRGLECDGKTRSCCKRQFYVDFKDIGWSDWIIAPSGYHANYCEGDCSGHMSAMGSSVPSFHSAVINHYRLRNIGPFQNVRSCCTPTRLRAMSMLYYDEENKIIKKDVRDMIVDECGCS